MKLVGNANWLHGLQRWVLVGALAFMTPLAIGACSQGGESQYTADWGPAVGTKAPLLAANDQDGQAQSLATLTGTNGVLVVFNRSVKW